MSTPGTPVARWAPRHRGWKLAHHLLPAFVLVGVLLGGAAWSAALAEFLLAVPLTALGLGVAFSILREYRRGAADAPPHPAAVDTTTGARAATRFPTSRASAATAGLTVGVAVVTLICALALGADTATEFDGAADSLPLIAAVLLLAVGVSVLVEGVRMLKLAVDQPPGVYLTRSRIVTVGQQATQEVFWKDVVSVDAEDPPRHRYLGQRQPLGERGPSRIVVRHRAGDAAGPPERMVILVQYLTCDPNQLLSTLEHFAAHPGDRPRLGTETALTDGAPGADPPAGRRF
ncbi:hypothetical protein [Zhihengliuella flava]|uniref:PH domain-containing protein n=1 Tax=Zhihengliuella flava TaxID=1285193 RepID=A0A931GLI4_9MICC|nr:hypothetical protein [Zhihengliuella flava]MBG6084484.1 hypothetical protein [Zhihengliuella flava]